MIHVVTVHHQSDRWIEVQTGYLARHLSQPYRTYASLEGIAPRWHDAFDVVVPSTGRHAGKLNHLARVATDGADPDDLLVFIDGDAIPITDPLPAITEALATTALVAVRRDENLGDRQPHPCFCATTVGTWRAIGGDWSNGATWTNAQGVEESDVGGNLRWQLEQAGLSWTPLLRSNHHDLHPLWFGVYGGVVYHHGAGFRSMLCRLDHQLASRGLGDSKLDGLRRKVRLQLRARDASRHSDEVFEQLRHDPEFWRRFA
jgi:hypothetical protein